MIKPEYQNEREKSVPFVVSGSLPLKYLNYISSGSYTTLFVIFHLMNVVCVQT